MRPMQEIKAVDFSMPLAGTGATGVQADRGHAAAQASATVRG